MRRTAILVVTLSLACVACAFRIQRAVRRQGSLAPIALRPSPAQCPPASSCSRATRRPRRRVRRRRPLPSRTSPRPPAAQIAVKWQFNGDRGYTELILLADGGWKLMGTFKNAGSARDLDVVIAVKSKTGTVFIFHRVGSAPNGEHQWDASASSPTIAQEFHGLTQGFDVRGAYRLPTPAVGSSEQKAERNEGACETAAPAAAWAPIWMWAAPHQKCYEFNIAN